MEITNLSAGQGADSANTNAENNIHTDGTPKSRLDFLKYVLPALVILGLGGFGVYKLIGSKADTLPNGDIFANKQFFDTATGDVGEAKLPASISYAQDPTNNPTWKVRVPNVTVSKDGTKIAYYNPETNKIYVVSSASGAIISEFTLPSSIGVPIKDNRPNSVVFDTTNSKLSLYVTTPTNTFGVAVVGADGANPQLLKDAASVVGFKDASSLVVTLYGKSADEVCSYKLADDTSTCTKLGAVAGGLGFMPYYQLSPDGSQIVTIKPFTGNDPTSPAKIVRWSQDGTLMDTTDILGISNPTRNIGLNFDWSPDSSSIAFATISNGGGGFPLACGGNLCTYNFVSKKMNPSPSVINASALGELGLSWSTYRHFVPPSLTVSNQTQSFSSGSVSTYTDFCAANKTCAYQFLTEHQPVYAASRVTSNKNYSVGTPLNGSGRDLVSYMVNTKDSRGNLIPSQFVKIANLSGSETYASQDEANNSWGIVGVAPNDAYIVLIHHTRVASVYGAYEDYRDEFWTIRPDGSNLQKVRTLPGRNDSQSIYNRSYTLTGKGDKVIVGITASSPTPATSGGMVGICSFSIVTSNSDMVCSKQNQISEAPVIRGLISSYSGLQVVMRVDGKIYRMNADGSGLTALATYDPLTQGMDGPYWTPDLSGFYYRQYNFNNTSCKLFKMGISDTSPTLLFGGTTLCPTFLPFVASTAAFVNPEPVASPNPSTTYTYTAINPARLADTRQNSGAPYAGKTLTAGGVLDVQVTGQAGIPADATAVTLNIVGVQPTAATYLTAYPTGQAVPQTSTLNLAVGQVRNVQTVTTLGTGGKVSIRNGYGSVNVVVDVVGYYGKDGKYTTFSGLPKRIIDTRTKLGGVTIPAGGTLNYTGPGVSGASSEDLNVTVVSPTSDGYLTIYPTGTSLPTTSSLNYKTGDVMAKMVTTKIGTSSTSGAVPFSIYNGGSKPIEVVVDIMGAQTNSGFSYAGVNPYRLMDTRASSGMPYAGKTLASGSTLNVKLPGDAPIGAKGIIANLTVVSSTGAGYLTVYPGGATRPETSNINFTQSSGIMTNQLMTAVDGNKSFNIYNMGGATDVIVDVAGYYY